MTTPPIRIEINVSIIQEQMGYARIQLSENLQLPQTDFLGLAAIMKKFHDLAEEITKAAQKSGGR